MKFTQQELRKLRELARRLILFGEVLFFVFRILDPAVSIIDWQIVLLSLTIAYVSIEVIVDKYR